MDATAQDITRALRAFNPDEDESKKRLMALVYEELLSLAQRELRQARRQHHTLVPADLVAEAYVRLAKQEKFDFKDRKHFFAYACLLIRHLIWDYERKRNANKGPGGKIFLQVEEVFGLYAPDHPGDGLDIIEGIARLYRVNERLGLVADLCVIAGLKRQDIAGMVGVSERTVTRYMKEIRALLALMLEME